MVRNISLFGQLLGALPRNSFESLVARVKSPPNFPPSSHRNLPPPGVM